MPQEANKKWGEDSFDKDDYRHPSPHVHACNDPHLTAVLNPHASEGGVHVSNQYPKPSGNYTSKG